MPFNAKSLLGCLHMNGRCQLNQPKKVIAVSTTRFNIFPYESTLEIWRMGKRKKAHWVIHNTCSISYLCWTKFKLFTIGLTRKRKNKYWYLSKLLRIKLPACEKIFVIPTIALLLQIHPKEKNLKLGVELCILAPQLLKFWNF